MEIKSKEGEIDTCLIAPSDAVFLGLSLALISYGQFQGLSLSLQKQNRDRQKL